MALFGLFKSSREDEKTAPLATTNDPTALQTQQPEAPSSASELITSPTVEPGETPISIPSAPAEAEEIESPVAPDAALAPEIAPISAADEAAPFIDFEREFAAPETPDASPTSAATLPVAPVIPALDEAELEEWSEPLPSAAPEILGSGTTLESPQGVLKIEAHLETRGGENIYRAILQSAGDEPQNVRLREASGIWGERLAREAMWRTHWDATARIAMLPRLFCTFKNSDVNYLATEILTEGPTFSQFFALEESKTDGERTETENAAFLTEILLVTTQIAAFLVRLHGAGFAHLGLRPDGIVPAKPVQILDCSFAAPLGEPLDTPLSFAGYSAPELLRPGLVDARSDLYAVGALLYRAVTGADVPESGADLSIWQPKIVMAGVPQILRRTLGEIDTRFNSAEELHRALVKLKNRLRPAISHAICGLSTIGLESTRSTNQDAFGFQSGAWETDQGPVAWTAFCVADGMGGMAAGEVASEVAVATFLRAASEWSAGAANLNAAPLAAATQAQMVKDWASLANEAVVRAMEARHARGGCTIDAGFIIDRRLCIAHVGDARLYLLRGGEFEVLSRDHSFVMSLLLQGQISFDDIRTHPERNKITRSLGERHPQPDYFIDGLQVQHGENSLELQPGDVVMACSDGLWEPVLESEMLTAIAGGDLARAARQMLQLALQRGAPDNATLILVRLDEHPAPVFA